MATSRSPLPPLYHFIFGVYEPLLGVVSALVTYLDPKATFISQANWPKGAPESIDNAAFLTIIQLGHVCGLIALLGGVIIAAIRRHLADQPILQEKMFMSYFGTLLFGDVTYLASTFWALGEHRYDYQHWSTVTWATFVLCTSLFIPRLCWVFGIGRFVAARDIATKQPTKLKE